MPVWLTSLFLHPEFLLPGAALLALPVIIHFINRLRFRRVKWAAMEFLLASEQRNRRRILLEQLLLLLLRLIVVAALVALVARLQLDPERFSLFQGKKTHHLVLVDDSGSMRDRWGDTSGFDSAIEVVRRIVAEGARKPDTQTLTLLMASRPDQPVFTQENLNKDFGGRLESIARGLVCSYGTIDAAAGADAARRLLATQEGAARNFHFLSDFRQHDWDDASPLAGVFREMKKDKIAVNLVKTVPDSHGNVGITDLTGAVDVAAANVPLRLSATVRNYGEQVVRDLRMNVLIDGKKLPAAETVESLEPGKEVTREFDVVFPTTGTHDVELSLPADALEQDNHRYLSIDLPEANPVLIIDGSPSNTEAFFLADALAPAPGITGFAPSIESVEYLRRRPIDKFQSVFLLNVAELPPDVLRLLEKYVSAGGGLAWYLGDQVRGAYYGDKLYQEGKGLFPCKLGATAELLVDETNPSPDVVFGRHPIFRVFEGEDNPFVDLVRVNRFFTIPRDWTAPDGVRVIATLRNKAPLILEHQFGKGKILTCLTSLGTEWNNWPQLPPVFVSMELEVARFIARSDRSRENKLVGEPLTFSLDAVTYGPQVEIRPPEGARVALMLGVARPAEGAAPPGDPAASGNLRYEDTYRRTDLPGLYEVTLKRQEGSPEARHYAVNVPEGESRLKLAATEGLRRRLDDADVKIQESQDFTWVHGEEQTHDVHDFVLIVLLVVLFAEQALALRLSFHPKPAGGQA